MLVRNDTRRAPCCRSTASPPPCCHRAPRDLTAHPRRRQRPGRTPLRRHAAGRVARGPRRPGHLLRGCAGLDRAGADAGHRERTQWRSGRELTFRGPDGTELRASRRRPSCGSATSATGSTCARCLHRGPGARDPYGRRRPPHRDRLDRPRAGARRRRRTWSTPSCGSFRGATCRGVRAAAAGRGHGPLEPAGRSTSS